MSMTEKDKKKRDTNIKRSSKNEEDYRSILRHGCSSNVIGKDDDRALYAWWRSMHC